MGNEIRVKICGLTNLAHVAAAVDARAAYVGFVFFSKSPRAILPENVAKLAVDIPPGIAKVALVVDMDDAGLDQILSSVPIDMVQLHGKESPTRVTEIRARYGLPVMKAVGVRSADDLPQLDHYAQVADQLLVDAKPAPGAELPGGNGLAFDWRLIAGRRWSVPWMLAGGLTPENVAEAIRLTGARQVDVSTGVETAPGMKDAGLITSFIEQAQV